MTERFEAEVTFVVSFDETDPVGKRFDPELDASRLIDDMLALGSDHWDLAGRNAEVELTKVDWSAV